jgi:hypothetical protein
MTQNLESTDFNLDQEDLDRIAKMDLNLRFNQPTNVSGIIFVSFFFSKTTLEHWLIPMGQYFSNDKLWIFG